MSEETLFRLHGLRAFAMSAVCGSCGGTWGHHVGMRCTDGHGTFTLASEYPELVALQTRPQHVEASCEEEPKYTAEQLAWILHGKRPASKTPTLDKLESGTDLDGKRAPLPYFTEQQERAKFDPFSDFIVHHREEASVNVKPFAGLSLDAPEQFRAPRSI